jgi:hypothetical protein
MKYVLCGGTALLLFCLLMSCKPAQKEMTPELFLTIENEILATDLTPESKEAVLKKYNLTLKQFEDYAQKVENDPALKEQIGEIRLKKIEGYSEEINFE